MAEYDRERWNMATRTTERWEVSRLVLKPGQTRRTRERIVIGYCAAGWLANTGFPREQPCNSVFDIGHEAYWAFHGGQHTTWRVTRWQGRRGLTACWCDAHLPGDIRELLEAQGGGYPPGLVRGPEIPNSATT